MGATGGDTKGGNSRESLGESQRIRNQVISDFLSDQNYKQPYWDMEAYKESAAELKQAREFEDRYTKLSEELDKHKLPYDELNEDDKELYDMGLPPIGPQAYDEDGQKLYDEWEKMDTAILFNENPSIDKINSKMDELKNRVYQLQRDVYKTKSTVFDTVDVSKNNYIGFDTTKFSNGWMKDAVKNGDGRYVEMTPKQYLQEISYYTFGKPIESVVGPSVSWENVIKYAAAMKDGVKFEPGYINYSEGQQEGRHRALAAYLNGVKKIPVFIVGG